MPGASASGAESPAVSALDWTELENLRPPPDSRVQRERGVGVAQLGYASDTLVVREAADPAARPVALLVRDSSLVFHLLTRAPASADRESLALEFGYEELGLPGVTPPRADGWTPVLYGVEVADTLAGWTRVDGERTLWKGWPEQLAGLPLFFVVPPDSQRLHPAPGEPAVDLALGDDYILHPLEVLGRWLRVEAVRPSDYCADPPAPRRDTAWVRYLDDRDRPRLWYFTRGC